ncbi:MAG: hypothetical protein WC757_01465 [Candidatus Paceibacterota bacterium]|jgi:hypothetical protein
MKGLSERRRWVYFIAVVIIFFVTIPFLILYATGYRFGDGFSLKQTGGIFIAVDVSGSDVLINNKLIKQTSFFQKNFFLQNLSPALYSIEVRKEGLQSWKKNLSVYEKEVTQAGSFMFPVVPKAVEITKYIETDVDASTTPRLLRRDENSLYPQVISLFASTSQKKLVSQKVVQVKATSTATTTDELIRQKMRIWKEKGSIFAEWKGGPDSLPPFFCDGTICQDKILVTPQTMQVGSFDFFPGREDVVLVTVPGGVFAIEVDWRGGQNKQSVYAVPGADFRVDNAETVYIKSDGKYFGLTF